MYHLCVDAESAARAINEALGPGSARTTLAAAPIVVLPHGVDAVAAMRALNAALGRASLAAAPS